VPEGDIGNRRPIGRSASRGGRPRPGSPAVGKQPRTEGIPAGYAYTEDAAAAFFARAIGEVNAQLAALASGLWIPRIPEGLRPIYVAAFEQQAVGSPRDSPANPLVHHVGQQIPAANRARAQQQGTR
jgi:hypothetical protein